MAPAYTVRSQLRWLPAFIVGIGSMACDDRQTAPPSDSQKDAVQAASAPTVQPNDPALAAAVRQAAKQAAAGSTAAEAGQPPPNGILGKSRADAEAEQGSPPKVTVGSTGSEPRHALGGGGSGKIPGAMQLGVRLGRSAMPTVAFELELSEGSSAPSIEGEPSQQQLLLSVKSADLAQQQPGQLPPSAGADIAKLKGSSVSLPLANGYLQGMPTVERAKGAIEDLDMILAASADAMGTIYAAYPKEPIGNGGFWMVTSRDVYMGSDVVTYRMYKVVAANSTGVSLEVNTKRYLVEPQIGFAGLSDREVLQFQGDEDGELNVKFGRGLPVEGRVTQRMLAVVKVPEQPERGAPFQVESQVAFTFPVTTTVTASATAK